MALGTIAKGTARSFALQVLKPDLVTPSDAFRADDALTARLWSGDDRTASASPAAAWLDATVAKYKIDFAAADTANLEPGVYRIRAEATRSGTTVEIFRDVVEILAVEGTGTAGPAYCTMADLQTECSWIGQVIDTAEDQTSFAEQRAAAREWMDNLILGAYPGARSSLATLADGWPSNFGQASYVADAWLRDQLAAGAVVTTGPRGRQLARVCACYALSLIFRAKAGPGSPVEKYAGFYLRRAQADAVNLIVELDTNADGVSDLAIPLGITNTRRG